jgi:tetratricopeptide (TPR) repeat protein
LTKGNPRLINQVCDLTMTHGFGLEAQVITSKIVAQAAFERSKGKILPLSSREELTVLSNLPDDIREIDAPTPQPTPAQWLENPHPERPATPAISPEPFFYAKGVAMRKEGRPKEAIEVLELAGKSPAYRLKAQVQIGLCHRAAGEHRTAIKIFRAALDDKSASRTELLDIQYFLARTLETAGQIAEAVEIYRRIADTNRRYKDAASRVHSLSSKVRYLTNGEQPAVNQSWIGNAIKSFPGWPLLVTR